MTCRLTAAGGIPLPRSPFTAPLHVLRLGSGPIGYAAQRRRRTSYVVPSRKRWNAIVSSFRARATTAVFLPRRRATRAHQRWSGAAATLFTASAAWAAWTQTARISLRPCLVIRPYSTRSPLARTLGASPAYATSFLPLGNRSIVSTAATRVWALIAPTPGIVSKRATRGSRPARWAVAGPTP
jgi:hypothetical protein